MRQTFLSVVLACALGLSMAVPALAVEQPSEIEAAGAYLRERGVYQGNGSGDLMLDKGLTRAEMAAVLTRLHGEGEVDPNHYTWACYFTDVPAWAKPYVGYCTANLLVAGYGASRYGPDDMVTPAMACTVVLRCCGYEDGEGSVWTYATACDYAVSLGLISQSTAQASIITRGEMAVLLCRALRAQEETPERPIEVAPSAYQTAPSGGVTISQDSWSREDFSQQANPAVFTGVYDRALYNAIRQTMLDGTSERPAYTMVAKGADYSAVKQMLGRMDGLLRYDHFVPQDLNNYYEYLNYFAVSAQMPDSYQTACTFIQLALAAVDGMGTDREKVEYLHDYLCGLLVYNRNGVAGISRIFSRHSAELEAACGDYAYAFGFLCEAAGIPCISISTTDHTWNMVYADGQWLHVDAAANDLYRRDHILLSKTVSNRIDRAPEATAFLKELLVPSSTK